MTLGADAEDFHVDRMLSFWRMSRCAALLLPMFPLLFGRSFAKAFHFQTDFVHFCYFQYFCSGIALKLLSGLISVCATLLSNKRASSCGQSTPLALESAASVLFAKSQEEPAWRGRRSLDRIRFLSSCPCDFSGLIWKFMKNRHRFYSCLCLTCPDSWSSLLFF